MLEAQPLFRDAFEAARQSSRLLIHSPPRAAEAWDLIKPFTSCTSFTEVRKRLSDACVTMILATAGDCHRMLGNPREAADWYRKALAYEGIYGYAGYYAMVVVDHRLADHLDSAVTAVNRKRIWWKQRSMFYRIITYGIWWLRYGLWRSEMWREVRLLDEYEDRLLQMSANGREDIIRQRLGL